MINKSFLIRLIENYRYHLIYPFFHLSQKGVMPEGAPCKVEDPETATTHGDIVHPCVRYIKEGFEGHQWWMVYTPYYDGIKSIENPRLCYADTKNGEVPTKWKFYSMINDTPKTGYNSDPTMLFYNGRLYIFWREVGTSRAKENGYEYATFGCYIDNGSIVRLSNNLLGEADIITDRECCPTFINHKGLFRVYAMHLRFTPKWIYKIPSQIASYLYRYKIIDVLNALGIYNSLKCMGVAIWNGNSLEQPFIYYKTVKFKGTNHFFQPWHMDLFSAEGDSRMYAIVQTDRKFANISLAYSRDGEQFHFYKKSLISGNKKGTNGLYKPTALVVDGKLYLFYTARDCLDPKLNRLFVTSVDWQSLLGKISSRPE